MKTPLLLSLGLAFVLPLPGAAKSSALISPPAKESARYVQAEQDLVAALMQPSLHQEVKEERKHQESTACRTIFQEIAESPRYQKIFEQLANYLHGGIMTALTDTEAMPDYLQEREFILRGLRALGNDQKAIEQIGKFGNQFYYKVYVSLPRLDPLIYREESEAVQAAYREHRRFIKALHPRWLEAAAPLLVLYYTLYAQLSEARKKEIKVTPDQIRISNY